MGADGESGEVIVDDPQSCSTCGGAAHIVMKDRRRLCARCYRDEKRPTGKPAAP